MLIYLIFFLFFFQIIASSASANKLSKLQERAQEYAAMIMEELDPNGLGYIEVYTFSVFFFFFLENGLAYPDFNQMGRVHSKWPKLHYGPELMVRLVL